MTNFTLHHCIPAHYIEMPTCVLERGRAELVVVPYTFVVRDAYVLRMYQLEREAKAKSGTIFWFEDRLPDGLKHTPAKSAYLQLQAKLATMTAVAKRQNCILARDIFKRTDGLIRTNLFEEMNKRGEVDKLTKLLESESDFVQEFLDQDNPVAACTNFIQARLDRKTPISDLAKDAIELSVDSQIRRINELIKPTKNGAGLVTQHILVPMHVFMLAPFIKEMTDNVNKWELNEDRSQLERLI